MTEADDLAALREAVRDAVRCHFDEPDAPKVIRLHHVHERALCVTFTHRPAAGDPAPEGYLMGKQTLKLTVRAAPRGAPH